jgi:hypothetical protein
MHYPSFRRGELFMIVSHKIAVVAATMFGLSVLGGCSMGGDPASEEPVSLKEGQYKVVLTGNTSGLGGLVPTKPADEGSVCIRAGYDEGNVATLAKQYLAFTSECAHSAKARVGNAVAGTVTCPLGPDLPNMSGSITTEYKGLIGTESIEIAGQMKMDIPKQILANSGDASPEEMQAGIDAMEDIVISVKAERTGDCS